MVVGTQDRYRMQQGEKKRNGRSLCQHKRAFCVHSCRPFDNLKGTAKSIRTQLIRFHLSSRLRVRCFRRRWPDCVRHNTVVAHQELSASLYQQFQI